MHNLAFAFLAAATTLPAQDAWAAWQERSKQQAGPTAPWLLVLRRQDAAGSWWLKLDLYRHLLATREFQVAVLPEPVSQDLARQREWRREPRWLLLSPDGAKQVEGNGRPAPERVLQELRDQGLIPLWERRAAFLKDNPLHGPARLEALREALLLGQLRLRALEGGAAALAARLAVRPPDPAAHAQEDSLYREAAEALHALGKVPRWWEKENAVIRALPLLPGGILPGPLAREARYLGGLALEELQRDPGDEQLWSVWGGLAALTGAETVRILDQAVPAPGQPWPPAVLLALLEGGFTAKGDWAGLLRALDTLRATTTREWVAASHWDAWRNRVAHLEVLRARALARLGHWKDATAALAEARYFAGQRWPALQPFLSRRGLPEAYGEQKALFQPLLDPEPLPDPPAPSSAKSLRLARLEARSWDQAWAALAASSELAAWGPEELQIGPLPPDLERSLRDRHGLTPGPRWVLVAEDELLASGSELPTARDLAQRLTLLAPSRLQRLDAFLEHHPEHRAGRRLRLDLLRTRMPNRFLEESLVEEARHLRARIRSGESWTPDPALWQWAAQQVLRALEADLECWPDHPGLWRDWLAWAKLHPQQPQAVLLARRLPTWGLEADLAARLPLEVHKAVAEELRQTGLFEEMRQWFQAAWDVVDKRPRGPGAPGLLRTQRRTLLEAIVLPLREALVVLRRDAEVVALDREVAAWLGEEGRNP